MRRILFLISLIIATTITTHSQTYTDVNGYWRYVYLKIKTGFAPPTDTLSSAPDSSIATKGTTLYIKWHGVWQAISGGGGSSQRFGVSGEDDASTQTRHFNINGHDFTIDFDGSGNNGLLFDHTANVGSLFYSTPSVGILLLMFLKMVQK